MLSCLDVMSGGRIDFGVGAGWKRDEWNAYGYGFPTLGDRQRRLQDALEIATSMFGRVRSTYVGETSSVEDAINIPQPTGRIPIIVGGNGREVTWRLAVRYADELNLDNVPPNEIVEAMQVIAERCQEIGRDPQTLRVSVHIWWESLENHDPIRLLRAYRDAGVARVMTLVRRSAEEDNALDAFRRQAVQAGAMLKG
jgi:alkanesulfonate monooxygenase SsuD/methylene tetrahydromethanopterin reductase-like flavin-dependent oxidoreductase (luciferase family)